MTEFTDELEEWLVGFLKEDPERSRILEKAERDIELQEQAYNLPWLRFLIRRRLMREADNI
jgi:hypothetical protein